MLNQFSRTRLIFGTQAMQALSESSVAVIGFGSAGASCTEALARSAVGRLALFSDGVITADSLGGNILANTANTGKKIADAAQERLLLINSGIKLEKHPLPSAGDMPSFEGFDFIVNATFNEGLTVLLAEAAQKSGVPIISILAFGEALSSAGAGYSIKDANKIGDAAAFAYALRKVGVKKHRVVYPINGGANAAEFENINACALGLIAAGEVIKNITGVTN